jgi:regulator of protease activity HflC (stomatin/prohibitin superfamily)
MSKEGKKKYRKIKKFIVRPFCVGYLYKNCQLKKVLESGTYKYWDRGDVMRMVALPIDGITLYGSNSILSKDNVTIRFSVFLSYKITDTERFLYHCEPYAEEDDDFGYTINDTLGSMARRRGENKVQRVVDIYLSKLLSDYTSTEMKGFASQITISDVIKLDTLNESLVDYGVTINSITIHSIVYPRNIQNAFVRNATAKIQAQTDLEKARTNVAVTRALKNAADILKDNEGLKFVQLLDVLSKAAESGKNSFVVDTKEIIRK